MSALLTVKDLQVSYGGINAVQGIDLHVDQGELVALIGDNGAGKSSSLKAIAGLLTPSAGEIHFANQETRKLPAYELVRLGLGMVPEGRGVFKRMTLLDEPSMGLSPIMVETIFDVVRSLSANGMTILLVEQNARLALQMADRAYVMESGLITLSGSGKELLEDPRVRAAYLGE